MVTTPAGTGKVKRLRHDPRVEAEQAGTPAPLEDRGHHAERSADRSIGGVVFRVGRDLKWLPANVAAKIMSLPTIAKPER